jgi:AcrR family transcriptional regulator
MVRAARPNPTTATPPARAADEAGTRLRLVEAAGEVFADRGFRDATVREICGAAGVNLAAVNYHFGDKQGLYLASLRYSMAAARDLHPVEAPAGTDARERLRHFVHALMRRMLGEGRPAWHARLMAREMVDPTDALETVVDEMIRPSFAVLARAVADLMGERSTRSERVKLACHGVIGQCMVYRHCMPVLRLLGTQPAAGTTATHLADHIADFSLGAIDGMARRVDAGHGVPARQGGHRR